MIRICICDLKRSLSENRYLFCIVFGLFFLLGMEGYRNYENIDIDGNYGMGNCLIELFWGMRNRTYTGLEHFEIPYKWLIIQILLVYIIANNNRRNGRNYENQIMIRIVNKKRWWFMKCMSDNCMIICFYLAAIGGLIASTLINTNMDWGIGETYCYEIYGWNRSIVSDIKDKWIFIMLLFILASLAISYIQLFVTVMTNEIYGFASVLVILAISAYYKSPVFIGNYLMLVRYSIIENSDIRLINGYVIMAVIIAGFTILGIILFGVKRIEVMRDENMCR